MHRPLLLVCLGVLTTPTIAADRPNILWITIEDMSPTLGCYGDDYARTPNIDRFARESVRYTNAFATSPVCSPSRSTLITGVHSTSLGTHDLRSAFPLPDFVHAWPQKLRKAGYFTSNNVKTDYNTRDEPRLIREAWEKNSPTAHWRDRKTGQPFFCVFNDMTTHQSRTGVWPWKRFRSEVQSRLTESQLHDPATAPVPPYFPDTPTVRRGIARFYDCVQVMDQNVGAILTQLREDGLGEDTIVFLYSDHGSGLPRGKRVLYDSGLRVPLLIRFPKKYRHLAPAEPGGTVRRLVSFVDFPATVLSLLNLPIDAQMQGQPFLGAAETPPRRYVFGARDRVDEAWDKSRSVRDQEYLYIRNYRPDRSLNQPSVYSDFSDLRQEITRLAKKDRLNPVQMAYAGAHRPVEELYDVKQDPLNLRNLAQEPDLQSVLERFREAHLAWMRETRDTGLYPEEHLREQLPSHGSAWEWARSFDVFPPEPVVAAAKLIGSDNRAALLDLLADPNPTVRLHAVQGLRSRGELNGKTLDALRRATSDADAVVAVEAAAAVGDTPRLLRALESDDEYQVLRAARGIELTGITIPEHLVILERVHEQWKDRTGSPIPLFIRFSLEATLRQHGRAPADSFVP